MLLRTLFALVLLTSLAETIVHGVHALAQSALRRQALMVVHDEVATATTAARAAIASAIAAGADPQSPDPSPPAPQPVCRLRLQRRCALLGSASIVFSSPRDTASPCPEQTCTVYDQANDAVTEGRIAVTISARASNAAGVVLAARSAHLTFRTLKIAPYAALAGNADGSVTGTALWSGDDAGATPNGTAPGTLIDVLYENAVTGATLPANVWHARVESASGKPAPWSP